MDAWQPLLDSLARLREGWPPEAWSWDGRFSTIASSFDKELEPQVRAAAVHVFPRGWTASSLDTAPPEMRALAERTGMRAGQRLLAGDNGLYGLWWPWGGGARITLRIGIMDVDARTDPFPQVIALFGVTI